MTGWELFGLGALLGIIAGLCYENLPGSDLRRVKRRHPGWFRPLTREDYPPEDNSMPDLSGIEVDYPDEA